MQAICSIVVVILALAGPGTRHRPTAGPVVDANVQYAGNGLPRLPQSAEAAKPPASAARAEAAVAVSQASSA